MDAKQDDYVKFGNLLMDLIMVVVIANSGFIARMRCWLYPLFTVIVAGFLYPCVYHWIYHPDGWLLNGLPYSDDKKYKLMYMDEGQAGLIHVFGGSVALIGSIIIGSRKERKSKFRTLGGNVNPLIAVGGVLAFVGLFARNNALQTIYPPDEDGIEGHVDKARLTELKLKLSNPNVAFINNLLSAQASAIIAFLLKRSKVCGDPSGTKALINGAIAGLIGVSCAPHQYLHYGALVIGVVTGLAYVSWTAIFQCCRIDDPTDAAAVHLGAGLWAVLAGPIFRYDTGIIYTYHTWRLALFGWQLLGGLAIFVWGGLTIFIIFLPFLISGKASYKENVYLEGLDLYEHKDPAFPPNMQYSDLTTIEHVEVPAVITKSFTSTEELTVGFGTRAMYEEMNY